VLKSNHRAWVEVDLGAIEFNVRQLIGALRSGTQLLAVVKADAYGHGSVAVSCSAIRAGATWLGVATLPEGVELRQAGITTPILILGAVNTPDEVRSLVEYNLQPTIFTPQQALIYHEVLGEQETLAVHVKVDTGMSRLGISYTEAVEFYRFLSGLPQLRIASIYSHLATADDPDPTELYRQNDRLQSVLRSLTSSGFSLPMVHLCNTAGMLTDRNLHYDLVRCGLGIYGYCPAPHLSDRLELRPALRVQARITHIKTIPAGTGVSYGYSFIADREMTIATVAIGYADGVVRGLSNRISVVVRGQVVRQIGTITMDQLLIDVSGVPEVQVGDVVTVLGEEFTAQTWAELLGTIPWEILCGFKHRLPRITHNRYDLLCQFAR